MMNPILNFGGFGGLAPHKKGGFGGAEPPHKSKNKFYVLHHMYWLLGKIVLVNAGVGAVMSGLL